jgi:hypothetical protein
VEGYLGVIKVVSAGRKELVVYSDNSDTVAILRELP